MAASWARHGLAWGDFDVLPLICGKIVDRGLIGSIALLEATKDYHLRRFLIDHCRMLIPEEHLLASCPDQRPSHCP